MRNIRNCAGRLNDRKTVTKLGELITADHKTHSDYWKLPGIGGKTAALNMIDEGTGSGGNAPLTGMTSDETAYAIGHFGGNDEIRRFYSDKSEIIAAAFRRLGIPWEHVQPGMPKNKAVAERKIGATSGGMHVYLCQAGLPDCLWPAAGLTYIHYRNIAVDYDGTSSWSRRTGSHWTSKMFPFGVLVYYLPNQTKIQGKEI